MLILINIEPAARTNMIFLKPRLNALYVEMMLAWQEKDLIAFGIVDNTNTAHLVTFVSHYSFYRNLFQHI